VSACDDKNITEVISGLQCAAVVGDRSRADCWLCRLAAAAAAAAGVSRAGRISCAGAAASLHDDSHGITAADASLAAAAAAAGSL